MAIVFEILLRTSIPLPKGLHVQFPLQPRESVAFKKNRWIPFQHLSKKSQFEIALEFKSLAPIFQRQPKRQKDNCHWQFATLFATSKIR